jgi:hypothetical protein
MVSNRVALFFDEQNIVQPLECARANNKETKRRRFQFEISALRQVLKCELSYSPLGAGGKK